MLPGVALSTLPEETLLQSWEKAPKRVAINEWDSLEQAQAFYNSAAAKNLEPQRERANKRIRYYAVEATQ